jgi:hypothetical protein
MDERFRVRVPHAIVATVPWMRSGKEQLELLGELHSPGIVKLVPWSPNGDKVVARKRELDQKLASDPLAVDALRELFFRYQRVLVDKEHRITLSPELQVHLAVNQYRGVYFVRVSDQVEIWSGARREQELLESHPALEDLPLAE